MPSTSFNSSKIYHNIDHLAEKMSGSSRDTVVLTSGFFEFIHYGHLHYLKYARSLGDIVVTHVMSDNTAREKRGPGRPLVNELIRAYTVDQLGLSDFIVISDGYASDTVLGRVFPDIYLVYDHVDMSDYESMDRLDKVITTFPDTEIIFMHEDRKLSTDSIVDKIKKLAKDV